MTKKFGGYAEASAEAVREATKLLREHGLTAWLVASQRSDEAILAADIDAQRFWDAVLILINGWEDQAGSA